MKKFKNYLQPEKIIKKSHFLFRKTKIACEIPNKIYNKIKFINLNKEKKIIIKFYEG